MSLIIRCLARSPPLRLCPRMGTAATVRDVKIKVMKPPKKLTHGTKNRALGRFFSPHLSIYKPQITSVLSILNRTSSILACCNTWCFGIGSFLLSHEDASFACMIEGLELSSTSLFILKYILVFPFAFHLSAACRHLVWETGSMLTIKEIYLTGYVMVACSFLLAGAIASL